MYVCFVVCLHDQFSIEHVGYVFFTPYLFHFHGTLVMEINDIPMWIVDFMCQANELNSEWLGVK